MATVKNESRCAVCKKNKAVLKCEGCSQEFCYNHSTEHREELTKQLETLEINRDLFRQTLTEKTAKPPNYVLELIEQINEWEHDSIKKIQRTAEKVRQIIQQDVENHGTEIEHQLNVLTDQLRESRRENNFNEADLLEWNQKLTHLSNGLVKRSKFIITQESVPLVNTIQVHLYDRDSWLSESNIHAQSKWTQRASTVAGGNGKGNTLNQFSCPFGIYVDYDQTVYVTDLENNRIVRWTSGSTEGQLVCGSNTKGDRANQLNYPIDAIMDNERHHFIICDQGNRRIVRWPCRNGRSTGETIISDIDCSRLTMDKYGYLYISDYIKHEVRRWNLEDRNGIVVAGGNGRGNRLDQFNCPTFIFVDEDRSVYVSDRDNHRVMKWIEGAGQGIVVAGFQGQGNGLTQLSRPEGLFVDHSGAVYIADHNNHRIMRWMKGATEGSIIVGKRDQVKRVNELVYPTALAYDKQANLYVTDSGNQRVQRYDIDEN